MSGREIDIGIRVADSSSEMLIPVIGATDVKSPGFRKADPLTRLWD
jgi:hypothetical protein